MWDKALDLNRTFANEELEMDASADEMIYLNLVSVEAKRTNAASRVRLD